MWNLWNVIFKSDALMVVDALNHPEPVYSRLGLIVEDCITLARDIQSSTLLLNQATHALVGGAPSIPDVVEWVTPPPF